MKIFRKISYREELAALKLVRENLLSSRTEHVMEYYKKSAYENGGMEVCRIDQFNMGENAQRTECGTIGCIGGMMAVALGITILSDIRIYVNQGGNRGYFKSLFFPRRGSLRAITIEQAVKAIDNFLEEGDLNPWHGIELENVVLTPIVEGELRYYDATG